MMIGSRFFCSGIAAAVIASCASFTAFAAMPTDPVRNAEFMILPNGTDLRKLSVSGSRLTLTRGQGRTFGASAQAAYEKLKRDSKAISGHPVQWVLMDLDNHQIVDQSASPDNKQFGASVSKIFVAATLMDKQGGAISSSQLKLMASMLVVSSNSAWTELQRQVGNGNSDRGREAIQAFTQKMGYSRTRGFQGYWGDLHGNELTVSELAEFLFDTYQGAYPGAETVWKLMHTHRTGYSRGRKYIPNTVFTGGKTGTYDGKTVDPETGKTTNANGSAFRVKVRHHVMAFNIEGRQYGLAILANTGSDESAAVMAGGLLREYTGYK